MFVVPLDHFQVESQVQGPCVAHITSIKVVSRNLPSEVTLYDPHTAEESLRRHRSDSHSQVLTDHSVQVRELLEVFLPPHQRDCVKGHLLYSRVGIMDSQSVCPSYTNKVFCVTGLTWSSFLHEQSILCDWPHLVVIRTHHFSSSRRS